MLKNGQKGRLSRWLLLLWVGPVYILVFWQEWLSWQTPKGLSTGKSKNPSSIPTPFFNPKDAGIVFFSVFMALHTSLYWISLSPAQRRRWYLLYFALQGLLVLCLNLFWGNDLIISLGLYLALIGEAVIVLQRVSLVGVVVIGYLALFALGQGVIFNETRKGAFDWSFYLMLIIPLIPFGVGYLQAQARERDQVLLHELEVTHAQLKEYAARVEDLTLVNERQRMARELHDTLAQGLAGVILQLEVANSHLTHRRSERAQEIVVQAMARARTTLADARRAIDDLRAQAASPGDLPEVVQQEINRFTEATGISCAADLAHLASTPAPLYEHILRAITEGLANVARHAQARQVWVQANASARGLQVEVRDDGIGFEPAAVAQQAGHYGLLGLRERARLAGGTFEITSRPGAGATLRLHLPGENKGDVP